VKDAALTDLQSSLTQLWQQQGHRTACSLRFFQANSAMPATARSIAIIDRDHLERQTIGDRDLQRELLTLFLKQSRKLIDMMHFDDMNEMRYLVHTMKGSARAIGAFDVAEAARALEEAMALGDGARSGQESAMAALGAAVDRSHVAIAAIVGEMA
jgi:HPt (histidine-containing phosphotransfer) domain-containing protein